MVFVTVGNATQQFRRLLDAVDGAAKWGAFGPERVVIQSGHNPDFHSQNCEVKQFVSMDEFEEMMATASLIICHGGCTQLQAIRLGRIPVVMPRREKYGEHVNDHQMQLVGALAAEGRIVAAYEPEELGAAIGEARRLNEGEVTVVSSPMIGLIRAAIAELTEQRAKG